MALDIQDGYTLPFCTDSVYREVSTGRAICEGMPTISGKYRPAAFDELVSWRFNMARVASGDEEAAHIAQMIASHLVDWDVRINGVKAPITAENVRAIKIEGIIYQLLNLVTKWAPAEQGKQEGN